MSYKDLTSVGPYNDDFNAEMNFLRILSVPGRPLQSREVTQAQTILQNQISQIANHLFRNGTPVLGARINLTQGKPGCRFHNRQVANRATGTLSAVPLCGSAPGALYQLSDFVGRTFDNTDPLGQNVDGVATKTLTVTHAILSDDESEIILYFTFGGSPVRTDDLYFDASGSAGTALKASGDLFFGMAASCEPGVIYHDGHFISVLKQEIIVGPGIDLEDGNFAIGFRFDERIITESDAYFGSFLNDPAAGFYNQAAPGAHRYQVMPVLDYFDRDKMDNIAGLPEEEKTAFNAFLARFSLLVETRGGDIILDQRDTQYSKLLDLLARRTYDESGNYTVQDFAMSVKESDTEANMNYELGPGKAYVLGYEIPKLASTRVTVPKARDYQALNNTYAQGAEHAYFVIENSNDDYGAVQVGRPLIFRGIDLSPGAELKGWDKGIDVSNGNSVPNASAVLIGTCRVHSLVKYGSEWRLYITDASGGMVNNAGSVKSLRPSSSVSGTSEQLVAVKCYNENQGSNIANTAIRGGSFRDPLIYEVNGATILKNLIPSETSYLHVVKKEGTFNGSGVVTFTADNNYQEFFEAVEDGIVLLIANDGGVWTQIANPTVSINNATNPATITLTSVANAGDACVVYLKVLESEGSIRSKTLANYTELLGSFTPNSAAVVTLAKEDCLRITAIRQMTNVRSDYPTPYNLTESDIAKLKFNTGQKDFYYDNGTVTGWNRLDTYANASASTQFEITYDYFNHSAGAHGFFCVNSYPFSEGDLDLIPEFKSANGRTYKLINCIDFRPKLSEIAGRTYLQPNTRFRADVEIYLARKDRVVLESNGNFTAIQGIPAVNADLPNEPANAMTLYTVSLNPYTYGPKDCKVKKIDQKRYTMRDIGALDKRLSNLEEYVAMSLLELRANDLEIIDATTGFNKFKNGIFADPFKGHQYGDTSDLTYRCAAEIYFGGGISCPAASKALDLDILSEPTSWANTITLPTDGSPEVFIKNEFASGSVNLNPYLFFTWTGMVELNPSIDTWFDTEQAPDIINEVVGTTTIVQPPSVISYDPMPTLSMPSLVAAWCGITPEQQESLTALNNASIEAANAAYQAALADWQARQAARGAEVGSTTSSTTETVTVNDRIVATNIAPYMRSIPVEVYARGMRQGAPVEAYLDNHRVQLYPLDSNYVTPANDPAGAGRPRVSSSGEFRGTFIVPPGTIPTGTKQFVIIDDEDSSSATTTFTAQGTIQVRQRTITSTRVTTVRITPPPIPGDVRPPNPGPTRPIRPRPLPINRDSTTGTPVPGGEGWVDPIAQSFLIEDAAGVFLASIDLFFKKKPTAADGIDDQPVTVYIVEMENGTPTNRIVPMSMVTKPSSEINAHETVPKNGATTFTFSDPIYLEGLTEYAFVVFSNSRKYEAWISTLGEHDIFDYFDQTGEIILPPPPDTNRSIGIEAGVTQTALLSDRFRSTGGVDVPGVSTTTNEQPTVQSGVLDNGSFLPRVDPGIAFRGTNGAGGRGIAEQPYLGSLFKSQNSSTWTADQLSDITFRIRRYKFQTAPATVTLRDKKTLPSNVITGATETFQGYGSVNATGTSIYPVADQVYGDSNPDNNPGALKVAATVLNVGDMVLPGTSLIYGQAFHTGVSTSNYTTVANKGLIYQTEEKQLDNNTNPAARKNYSAQITLGTSNPYLTPVIDREQMRLITSRYLASQHDLSTEGLDLIIEANGYDFGPAWDAGTYISKTVNLVNPSDDLKVLVDAKLPADSTIKVYYRTSVVEPSYFSILGGTVTSSDLTGKVCRLVYRELTTDTMGNPHGTTPNNTPSFTSSNNPKVRCLVTNVDGSTVYVKSVNDINKFVPQTAHANIDRIFIVSETTAVDLEAQVVSTIDDWSGATDYSNVANPQYVLHVGRLWKRNSAFVGYAPGMEPSVGGSAWIDIPYAELGTTISAAPPIEWRDMVLDEDVNPNISVGTQFVEYKYRPVDIPEDFTSFSIKIEMYSKNPIDVPIVKNLRAIAVI